MRTCFLSSQMNAIVGFSARLNGVRRGHPAKMSSRQKQETPKCGLSGTHNDRVENLSRIGPQIGVRVDEDFLKLIDEWRRKQDDVPTRPEAIRRLVEIGLKAKGK
jgi:hypothetical protein